MSVPDLPAVPGVIRRFAHHHARTVDVVVVVVVPVPGLAVLLTTSDVPEILVPGWVRVAWVVLALVAGLVLLARRRAPVLVLVVVTGAVGLSAVLQGSVDPLPIMFALYAVAVHASVRQAWTGLAVSVTAVLAAAALAMVTAAPLGARGSGGALFSAATVLPRVALVSTLVGTSVGDRRRYVAALVELAERLERERDQRSRLAVAAERARITRDVQDVVSHGLSVIVALSDGAAAVIGKDPDDARRAVREVGDVGRGSLAEMSRLLGVLRVPEGARPGPLDAVGDPPLHPQPCAEEVPALVATARAAGLPVALEQEGTVPDDPVLQTAVYRVVQEVLTNALRYAADPSAVVVRVGSGPGSTDVSVTDDGREPGAPRASEGGGSGLVGMRERVTMLGGALVAGPLGDRGWEVRATCPQAGER